MKNRRSATSNRILSFALALIMTIGLLLAMPAMVRADAGTPEYS